jgi:Uma2 family endonuclease
VASGGLGNEHSTDICDCMNALASLPVRHKVGLRATDYLMLSDAGAFDHLGRTELIEGEIWTMNAIHSWHAKAVADLTFELTLLLRPLGGPFRVFTSGSVHMTDDSVPEPDVFVGEDNDRGVLPIEKLRLAIEVSDSTAAQDLGVKLRLYAQAGVPEYWVFERETATIHQFWEPQPEGYAQSRELSFGEPIASEILPGIAIETSAIDR